MHPALLINRDDEITARSIDAQISVKNYAKFRRNAIRWTNNSNNNNNSNSNCNNNNNNNNNNNSNYNKYYYYYYYNS